VAKPAESQQEPAYLDVQAQVGITKHIGGFEATDELLGCCGRCPERRITYQNKRQCAR
jgi:hypothetical protein